MNLPDFDAKVILSPLTCSKLQSRKLQVVLAVDRLGVALEKGRREREAKRRLMALQTIIMVFKPKIKKWRKHKAVDAMVDFLTMVLNDNKVKKGGQKLLRNIRRVQVC